MRKSRMRSTRLFSSVRSCKEFYGRTEGGPIHLFYVFVLSPSHHRIRRKKRESGISTPSQWEERPARHSAAFHPLICTRLQGEYKERFSAVAYLHPLVLPMSFILVSGLTEGVIELTLYGGFTVLFSTVVYLFSTRGLISRRSPSFYVFLALVALFLTVTAHWINSIYSLYHAFIHLGGGFEAEVFYLTLADPPELANQSLAELATIIADCLMIHRLYIVYSHDLRVIVFAICVEIVQIVSGVHAIVNLSRETILNYYASSNPWVTTSLGSSLVISAYCTGMIGFKITRMSRSIRSLTGNARAGQRLNRVLAVIVESAVLQTIMTMGTLILFQIGLLQQAIFEALTPVVFGISVLLIHLRAGLGWTTEGTNALGSASTEMTVSLSTSRQRGGRQSDLEGGKPAPF
ncbi:hypothetical protein K438DRAFT_1820599 [Mycena galopus ATCC 62051]|nr:hypothetical protein K438DRAFT_1820599 [Mycena galopus ATCC 62051]